MAEVLIARDHKFTTEQTPTYERDGWEEVEIPRGPSLLPEGAQRVFLRPGRSMRDSAVFLNYDPNRADVFQASIPNQISRHLLLTGFIEREGYKLMDTQFPRHIVAARTKPQAPKPTSAS